MTTFQTPPTPARRARALDVARLRANPFAPTASASVPGAWTRRATDTQADTQAGAPDGLEILFDITRLLSRVLHSTPTGVDRVEHAFARELLRTHGERVAFVAAHPTGLRGRLSRKAVEAFLRDTEERWTTMASDEPLDRALRRAARSALMLPRLGAGRRGRRRAYLHASSSGLDRPAGLLRLLEAEGARYVPLVHDLIPLQHPEYARPGGAERFGRRLDALTALAAGAVCNSVTTATALRGHFARAGRRTPIRATPLATAFAPPPSREGAAAPAPGTGMRPYFVVLGTIEPRKNHLMLLQIWRELARNGDGDGDGDGLPALVLIGRRGWENEMVLDLLDRCPDLCGLVFERGRLPDREVCSLIPGARALLMPSFAEGFGLPVAEALALGAPVIASDLPALREAGGGAPDYLDPLDGRAWREAVLDYARPDSPRRAAQLGRLAGWRPRPWAEPVRETVAFLQEVCG